jgi:alcohol dehydrogenase (cytochrome c)
MAKWATVAIALTAAAIGAPASGAAPTAYGVQCAACHGGDMGGGQFGPSLKSAAFIAKWKGRNAELLKYISAEMPPKAGGSLTAAEYAAVANDVIKANGAALKGTPATPQEAKAFNPAAENAAEGIGPRPLPPATFEDAIYKREKEQHQALLAALTPVTPEMLHAPPPDDWLSARRTQDAAGYSPLKQIDRTSVSKLKLKWAWSVKNGKNEIAPIVHDGVMFLTSATDVEALDAASGAVLWRYSREVAPEYRGPLNMIQRSMAILGRLVYVSTADRHIVALDATSGKVVWDTEIVPPSIPSSITSSGPMVAGNVIVEGTSIGPTCTGGCYVVGLDATTGKQLWRFDNVARDGSVGGDTWNGTPAAERTGAAVWNAPSYDPALDLIFFGTGGTYDIKTLLKANATAPGQNNDALFTDSTLALRPKTGELVWYHQHLQRDVWDLDESFERTLMNVPVDGRERQLVVTIGKIGILDALDRKDGSYAFSIDLGLNNIVKGIDPHTGRRTYDPATTPTPNKPVGICPSVLGARNWMGTAYNSTRRVLFLPLQEVCMDFTWVDPSTALGGKINMAWTIKHPPGTDGLYGRLEAIDMTTHKTLWRNRIRALPSSALLATDGGIVFAGTSDRVFRAHDDKTGKVLWETRLSAVPSATPVTFTVGGKQYVAITSGGGGDNQAELDQMTPELTSGPPATTIWVFGL